MLTKMISKNGLILAIFAAVCVGLIAVTYYVTRDTIAGEMEAALDKGAKKIRLCQHLDMAGRHVFVDGCAPGRLPGGRARGDSPSGGCLRGAVARPGPLCALSGSRPGSGDIGS